MQSQYHDYIILSIELWDEKIDDCQLLSIKKAEPLLTQTFLDIY
jgi:hypothetical protein